jgi:hypothetical protein
LPPAEVEDGAVVLQFEQYRQHVPELLEALRAGTLAEPVPVVMDGATFIIHGATRSFWVRLWHSSPERTRVERVQLVSCMPSTRGVQLIVDDPEDDVDYEDDDDLDDDADDDFDDEPGEGELDEDDEALPR